MSEVVRGLEHDEVRPYLIRDLAVSDKTQKELAEQYGYSAASVSNFRKKHQDEIDNYRESLPPAPDALSELWAVDKAAEGHTVVVSEYAHNVPDDWKVIWSHDSKQSIRNSEYGNTITKEVLMTPKYNAS